MLPDAPDSLKEWIAVIGVILIILILVPWDAFGGSGEVNEDLPAIFVVVIADWFAIVNFFDFLGGLQRIGLPDVAAWPIAVAGTIMIIALSFAAFVVAEDGSRRAQLVAWVIWFTAIAAHAVVAFGPPWSNLAGKIGVSG